jgi:hypothetical protein
MPLYAECAVTRKAVLLNPAAHPIYPTPRDNQCFSATLRFVVDSTGAPETATARVVRSTDFAFGQSLLSYLPHWHYRPAELEGHHVRQLVTESRAATTQVTAVSAPTGRGRGSRSSPDPTAPTPSC